MGTVLTKSVWHICWVVCVDLIAAAEILKETKSVRAVAEAYPATYIRYHRGVDRLYETLYDTPRMLEQDAQVLVLHGDTGTGKTRRAYALASSLPGGFYVKMSYNQWWRNYRGEQTILIDEYAGQWPLCYLLQVLDRYAMDIEYKGGGVNLQAKRFIITSNINPLDWYTGTNNKHQLALQRRISKVIEVTSKEQEIDFSDFQ